MMVKKLKNIRNNEISVREKAYRKSLDKADTGGGDIELFS